MGKRVAVGGLRAARFCGYCGYCSYCSQGSNALASCCNTA